MHIDQLVQALHALQTTEVVPRFYGGRPGALSRCPHCAVWWVVDLPHTLSWQYAPKESDAFSAPCRACAAMHPGGVLEVDEYGQGKGGYGVNWEAPLPMGAHLIATVLSSSWLMRQQQISVQLVSQPMLLHAVLQWLGTLKRLPIWHLITQEEAGQLAHGVTPGHGDQSGDWCWQGMIGSLFCPPLEAHVELFLGVALPAAEPLHPISLFEAWRLLAALLTLLPLSDLIRPGGQP